MFPQTPVTTTTDNATASLIFPQKCLKQFTPFLNNCKDRLYALRLYIYIYIYEHEKKKETKRREKQILQNCGFYPFFTT